METTLDAWEVLHAVVQLGGFAPAARKLHRSQSTISYAIARLEEQLGVQLFEMQGRRAHLTEHGRALLADAEPHLSGFRALEQYARALAAGGAAEIRLSVDNLYPNERLFAILAEFARSYPSVRILLRQGSFISADNEISAHNAQLCIAGLFSREFFSQQVLGIRMIAVARRDHPLFGVKHKLTRNDLSQYMMAAIEGESSGVMKRQPRGPAQKALSVSSIEAAIEAVRSGLCFGWLPVHRIEDDLKSGALTPLPLPAGREREVRLNLICRDLDAGSEEIQALAELLGIHRAAEMI